MDGMGEALRRVCVQCATVSCAKEKIVRASGEMEIIRRQLSGLKKFCLKALYVRSALPGWTLSCILTRQSSFGTVTRFTSERFPGSLQ